MPDETKRKPLHLRLRPDLLDEVAAMAGKENRSMANTVEVLVDEAITRRKQQAEIDRGTAVGAV